MRKVIPAVFIAIGLLAITAAGQKLQPPKLEPNIWLQLHQDKLSNFLRWSRRLSLGEG